MDVKRTARRRLLVLLLSVFVLQTGAGLALGARMFSTEDHEARSDATVQREPQSLEGLPLMASAGIAHPPRTGASTSTELAITSGPPPGSSTGDANSAFDRGEAQGQTENPPVVDVAGVPATSGESASTTGGQPVDAIGSFRGQVAGLPGLTEARATVGNDGADESFALAVEDPAILATQAESLPSSDISLMLGAPPVELFPVLGGGPYTSSFGAPRDGGARQHKGNDIFAEKMTPVLAVAPGTVVGAPSGPGEKCCYLKVEHEDGAQSVYLHLNNDTPGTDDGRGWGLADGIAKGVHVEAGDVIGYVGDSGNAEETDSHLHFEYRVGGTEAIDPFELLNSAPVLASLDEEVITLEADTSDPVSELPYTGFDLRWLALLSAVLVTSGSGLLLGSAPRGPRGRHGVL